MFQILQIIKFDQRIAEAETPQVDQAFPIRLDECAKEKDMRLQQRPLRGQVYGEWPCKTKPTQLHWWWELTVPFIKGLEVSSRLLYLWPGCSLQVKSYVCA
jgi:hypothetical protein